MRAGSGDVGRVTESLKALVTSVADETKAPAAIAGVGVFIVVSAVSGTRMEYRINEFHEHCRYFTNFDATRHLLPRRRGWW